MALGPSVIGDKRLDVLKRAEAHIDEAIRGATEARVTVATALLGITRDEWTRHLWPKYFAAGWKAAEWKSDQRDGDYLDLKS